MTTIVTNNPQVHKWLGERESDNLCIIWVDGGLDTVIVAARDLVHQGWKLANHPLSSSIKPNQTPFKTLVLVKTKTGVDYQSLRAIEAAQAASMKLGQFPGASPQTLEDLQILDLEMLLNTDLLNLRGV